MLRHEYNVEYDRYVGQAQFDRVARDSGPVALQT